MINMNLAIVVTLVVVLLVPVNAFAVSYNEYGYPKQYLTAVLDSCENGIWYAHFEDEKTGERVKSGKVFIYDEAGLRTHTTSLNPSTGTVQITLDGNEKYPKVDSILVRTQYYEDLTGVPECVALPDWIKQSASWWANDMVTDNEFILMIQYLIANNIINIPESPTMENSGDKSVPSWIKNTAKWWSEGAISESDFLKSIKYLVTNGIIQIDTTTTESGKVVFEVIDCAVDGDHVKVSLSATNLNSYAVDVDFMMLGLDARGTPLTMTQGFIYGLGPSAVQYDYGYVDHREDVVGCGIHINTIWQANR